MDCPLLGQLYLPPLPPPLSQLLGYSPPSTSRQDSIGGGGVSMGVASFPPGSHWPAGLLTRLWLAVPIPISLSHWLWSLSAVCGLDTSDTPGGGERICFCPILSHEPIQTAHSLPPAQPPSTCSSLHLQGAAPPPRQRPLPSPLQWCLPCFTRDFGFFLLLLG